jgi:hypothetical protein
MCDLEDRIASDYEMGFSEQALRQLMKSVPARDGTEAPDG